MRFDPVVPWTMDLPNRSPLFHPLAPCLSRFANFTSWPQLADYQRMLDEQPEPIRTLAGQPLKIVAQDGRPDHFEAHYAPRIYQTGEIQTRCENWHDFFQFLSWFIFPKTKAVINALHLPLARARFDRGEHGRRSPLENTLSLFDEGGAVIIASDDSLLQAIRDFRWQELFWRRRDELDGKLRCIVFGHALYEKALAPYVGMTANTVLLSASPEIIASTMSAQLRWADERLASIFAAGKLQQPRDLAPFPILGLPHYDTANNCAEYYENKNYFRPGRQRAHDLGNA